MALLALARPLVDEAGRRLVDSLSAPRPTESTKTSATDLVTAMDRAVEALLVESILAARPEDGIEGEEGSSRPGTSGVRWHIDPIDGTVNYVHGIPGFCVSVAAEVGGAVVAGVVSSPLHGELFTATAGGGAWRNDIPIHCSGATELATALIATGFSYQSDRRRRQAETLVQVLPRVADVRRLGAAALDLCWVACGRYDGYYEPGLNTWDHAAGALIASEAGAVVGDLAGGPPNVGFVVAAPPLLFGPLRDLLVASGAEPFDDPWLPLGSSMRQALVVGTRILSVEDDERIRTAVKLALEDEGWTVDEAANGEEALAQFTRSPADVVLIDIMLPDIDGFEVCRAIRRNSAVPIIMVTARDDTHDVVAGLEAGADDYLTKPFAPKELSARIRALLRRVRSVDPSRAHLQFDDLEVIPDEGVVRRAGQEIHLTKTEFRLLVELASSPGRVFSREVLLERVWQHDYFGDGRLVDVHVRRLRTKVEADAANPRHVVTVRGLGYKLQV